MNDSLFSRRILPGESIRPILVSGVLEKEYPGPRGGDAVRTYLNAAYEEAKTDLARTDFRELDSFTLCGMTGRWTMCTAASPVYADGHYYVMERLGMMPIFLHLRSEGEQTVRLRVNGGRMLILLNGEPLPDEKPEAPEAPEAPRMHYHYRSYTFEHGGQWVNRPGKPGGRIVALTLKDGVNTLCLATGKIDRGTGISFRMELLEAEAPVWAEIPLSMPEDVRTAIAQSRLTTHMIDDCWKEGEEPVLYVGAVDSTLCRVSASLKTGEGETIRTEPDAAGREIRFPADLNGRYRAEVTWTLPDGTPLDTVSLPFGVVRVLDPDPGFDRMGARRLKATELLAERKNPLALYRLGRTDEITEELIDRQCGRIDRWADCADFDLLPLLWLAWEDRGPRQLREAVHERIKKAALSFRYWVDEPGLSSMFYCSENHRIGFHVCEYLAGLLYPTDVFTNTNQSGMYHSLKGRMHLVEWLGQRCRFGFDEPHSDSYIPITLSAILVLREVLPKEEYPLRNMVNVLLDYISFILAVSDFDGVMATPRGRSYNAPLRSHLNSGTTSVFWMLFGNAPSGRNMHQELAFSPYVPPKAICELADNFTPATFTFREGLMHFDKHNADFTIRRTPEYMIGGVRDHNVGLNDMHFEPAMIALRGDISIFFSAPNNVAEGSGLRPDYWAGEAALPRVLMTGRTLAVIWHGVNAPSIWMTHCHFNRRKFDEIVERDGWTFGRKGDGYVGIWSSVPHAFGETGPYAGRELICPGHETVWIAECGSRREDGEFADFIARLCANAPHADADGVRFSSGSGELAFGLTEGFTVNGEEVPVPEYTVNCPYLVSRFGSGRFAYKLPGFTVTHWTYPACE